ncbi:hypothetical protein BH10ACI1_BH10ACI1_20310 [soil metagenome]
MKHYFIFGVVLTFLFLSHGISARTFTSVLNGGTKIGWRGGFRAC